MTDIGGFETCHEARAWSEDEIRALLRAIDGVLSWTYLHVPYGTHKMLSRILQEVLHNITITSDRNCPNCRHLGELRYENIGTQTANLTIASTCEHAVGGWPVYPDEMFLAPCRVEDVDHFSRRDDG